MSEFDNTVQGRHAIAILKRIYNFYKEDLLCNVQLVVGGNRFPVHKLILMSNSDLLKTKLNDTNSEVIVEDSHEIQVESVKKAIKYFYLGEIVLDMKLHEVINIIKFSKMIQADELQEYCLAYLERMIDSENFLFIEEYAKQNGYLRLLEQAKIYITNNYLEIIQGEEFLNISFDRMSELLQSDDLKVITEEQVFNGLALWVQKDSDCRKKYLNTLLKHIRLPLLPIEFLLNEVKPLCLDSVYCSQISWDILEWYQKPEKRSYLTLNSKPRKSTKQTMLIVGDDSTEISDEIETYNLNVEKWSPYYNLNKKITSFGAVVLDHKLIMIGGEFYGKTTNRVCSLDLATKQTSELKAIQKERERFAATVVDGHVFIFGGYYNNNINTLNSVEKYDLVSNTWTYVAPMLTARCEHDISVIGNEIYAIGGYDGVNYLNTMEVYDIRSNNWTIAPSFIEKRCAHAAVALGDYIYIIGGFDKGTCPKSVERFNIKSKIWTRVADLPKVLNGHRAVVFNEKIVCVGGQGSRAVLEYDPSIDKWTERENISKSRIFFNLLFAPSELFM
ncbi:kelch-like protein 5 [Arctopsyche grandis]|uniref:kelch-like protein 5 n=1 Tax=Arctopsyche grandis TaxID=121162 RepID=UPI00406D7BE7